MDIGHSPLHRRAFSLIELLVVMAIIAILAALVLMISGFAHYQSAKNLAEAQIGSLSAALEATKP